MGVSLKEVCGKAPVQTKAGIDYVTDMLLLCTFTEINEGSIIKESWFVLHKCSVIGSNPDMLALVKMFRKRQ